jgi:hypothetical protein
VSHRACLRRTRVLLGLVAVLLAPAACTGAGEEAEPTATWTSAAPSPTPTPTPGPSWPLTGQPAPAAVAQPVLVVKVDNTASAQPQLGLAAADLVVEEPVEGGLTRLAVMVQSRLPTDGSLPVGPVRSVRTSDAGIVAPTAGVLVASGGAPPALDALRAAGVRTVFEGSAGFSRDRSRRAPSNLLVDLPVLAAGYPTEPLAPSYLQRGDPAALPPGTSATTLDLRFSGAHTTVLAWSGSGWARTGPPDGFVSVAVLALLLPVTDAGYLDPAGNPVPELVTEAAGDGVLAHAGEVLPLRWSKAAPAAPWVLTTQAGAPLAVPPGPVYLALLPAATGSIGTG